VERHYRREYSAVLREARRSTARGGRDVRLRAGLPRRPVHRRCLPPPRLARQSGGPTKRVHGRHRAMRRRGRVTTPSCTLIPLVADRLGHVSRWPMDRQRGNCPSDGVGCVGWSRRLGRRPGRRVEASVGAPPLHLVGAAMGGAPAGVVRSSNPGGWTERRVRVRATIRPPKRRQGGTMNRRYRRSGGLLMACARLRAGASIERDPRVAVPDAGAGWKTSAADEAGRRSCAGRPSA
jgi:hypothetical protein